MQPKIFAAALFSFAALGAADFKPAPKGLLMRPETCNAKSPDRFRARFRTTQGDFVIEVTRAWAPNGSDRFYNLVRNRWYDDNFFYDISPNSIVKFGISSTPVLNKTWTVRATNINDDPAKFKTNALGYVSFDQDGMNSRTTRILVNLAENSKLDLQGIRPIGMVVEGLEVLKKMQAAKIDTAKLTADGGDFVKKTSPQAMQIRSAVIEKEEIFAPKPAAPAAKPAAPAPAKTVKKK